MFIGYLHKTNNDNNKGQLTSRDEDLDSNDLPHRRGPAKTQGKQTLFNHTEV